MRRRRWNLSAYSILFWIIVLMAVLTWVIPAGSYDRLEDGAPVSGSYHSVPRSGQGLGAIALSSIHGFYDAVEIALFILMVGGFLGVVMQTGAIDAGIGRVVRRMAGRESRMIPVLMVLFGLGGTTFGMWEETMAFYPLLIPVFTAAGYDALTAIAVVVLGAGTGTLCSTVNPFATGIASGFAGVSMGQGILLRLLMLAVLLPLAIWWVLRHARRVRRSTGAAAAAPPAEAGALTRAQKTTLWCFGLTFALMVYSVIPFDELGLPLPTLGWYFPELAGLFLVSGMIIGFLARLREQQVYDAFLKGAGDLLGVAFIIALSRGITVVMNDGGITDTILYWGERGLSGAHAMVFILLVFALYLGLSFLIPSSSGLATLSVPVLAPLGVFAGVTGSLIVTAFQAASGLVNLITPTSAVIMGALALGEVSYPRWLRFAAGYLVLALVLSAGALLLGTVLPAIA